MKGTGAKPANVREIMTQHFDPADEHDVLDPERLATPSGVAAVLERCGLAPRKGLGQNFLVDRNVLRRIIDAARLTPEDTVIEIGPGLGVLTWALADAARTVIAVEVDAGLVRWLERLLRARDNVRLVHADALEVDFHALLAEHPPGPGGAGKVIANLPYYITTPLLMRFLEEGPPLDSMVVMVQREVAQRLTARPGTKDYGALSVAVQLRADVETVGVVSPHVFFPKPAVESAVVRLKLRPLPGDVLDEAVLFAVVRAAFGQRRKTLRNALRAAAKASGGPASEAAPSPRRRGRGEGPGETGAPWPDRAVEDALAAAGIDGARRGETLSPAEFVRLANALAARSG